MNKKKVTLQGIRIGKKINTLLNRYPNGRNQRTKSSNL